MSGPGDASTHGSAPPAGLDSGAASDSAREEIGVAEGGPEEPGPSNGGSPPQLLPHPTPSPSPGPPPTPPTPVEPPSPDVTLAEEASPLPGAHRDGFSRLPTAPIPVTFSAPAEPGTAGEEAVRVEWLMPAASAPHRALAPWALTFSIAGLVVSLFVGWGFPIGLVGAVTAIVALRRPVESRSIATWALVLGLVSILYSAGWLLWAASRTNLVM